MRTAILVAALPAGDRPAALLPLGGETPLARIVRQARAAGCEEVVVVTRAAWRSACGAAVGDGARVVGATDAASWYAAIGAAAGGGDVLVAEAEWVVHDAAVESLLAGPRAGALVEEPRGGETGFDVRTVRGRVVAAASPYHTVTAGTGRSLGLMRADAGAIARALEPLARGLPPAWGPPAPEVVPVLLVALVRGGARVAATPLRTYFCARVTTAEDARAVADRLAGADERRARTAAAVKAEDGFFGTFFCSPWTRYVARWCAGRGIRPNQVTLGGAALSVPAIVAFSRGTRGWLIAGAILYYLTLAFDCVDGQLARYSLRFTALGAWLDPMLDRAKEYGAYAALAHGAIRGGEPRAAMWALAAAAMVLLAVRHLTDFAFEFRQDLVAEASLPPPLPLEEARDLRGLRGGGQAALAARAIAAWSRTDEARATYWAKRLLMFPIGDRYAALAVGAAVSSPRSVLVVMLVWGGVALLYGSTGRVLRSAA